VGDKVTEISEVGLGQANIFSPPIPIKTKASLIILEKLPLVLLEDIENKGKIGMVLNGDYHGYYDDDDDEDDGENRVPPHEWLAKKLARNQISSSSVCEGVGRTLKGRDLSKVRNAILTKTGFLDIMLMVMGCAVIGLTQGGIATLQNFPSQKVAKALLHLNKGPPLKRPVQDPTAPQIVGNFPFCRHQQP
ncbi:hypothetical protein CUMW_014850, partial [Citrus unshiu]